MTARPAVVLLSGGMDSATVLTLAKAQGYAPYALSVRYGQRHGAELDAAKRIARALGALRHEIVELDEPGCGGVGQERPVLLVEDGGVVAHDRGADRRRADVADEEVHGGTPRGGSGSVGPDGGVGRPRIGEPELARVQDAVRVQRLLGGDEDVEGGSERIAHEPRPVEADAVVVTQEDVR